MEASLAPSASKTAEEHSSVTDKGAVLRSEGESATLTASIPEILDPSIKDAPRHKVDSEGQSVTMTSQLPTVSDQKVSSAASSGSVSGGVTSTAVSSTGTTSVTPNQEGVMSLSSLLPGGKVGSLVQVREG